MLSYYTFHDSMFYFTCMRALMCFEMGTFCVHLPAAIEVTPVHPPPPVWRSLSIGQASLFQRSPNPPCPYFARRMQHSLYPTPHLGHGALLASLRRRWRSTYNCGAQIFSFTQNITQRVGGEVESRRELLGAVRCFAAGVRMEAAGLEVRAVLIVLLFDVRDLWV